MEESNANLEFRIGDTVFNVPVPDDKAHRYAITTSVLVARRPDDVPTWRFWNLRRIKNLLKYRLFSLIEPMASKDGSSSAGMVPGIWYSVRRTYLDGKIDGEIIEPANSENPRIIDGLAA